jgi:hypothetical protein
MVLLTVTSISVDDNHILLVAQKHHLLSCLSYNLSWLYLTLYASPTASILAQAPSFLFWITTGQVRAYRYASTLVPVSQNNNSFKILNPYLVFLQYSAQIPLVLSNSYRCRSYFWFTLLWPFWQFWSLLNRQTSTPGPLQSLSCNRLLLPQVYTSF